MSKLLQMPFADKTEHLITNRQDLWGYLSVLLVIYGAGITGVFIGVTYKVLPMWGALVALWAWAAVSCWLVKRILIRLVFVVPNVYDRKYPRFHLNFEPPLVPLGNGPWVMSDEEVHRRKRIAFARELELETVHFAMSANRLMVGGYPISLTAPIEEIEEYIASMYALRAELKVEDRIPTGNARVKEARAAVAQAHRDYTAAETQRDQKPHNL